MLRSSRYRRLQWRALPSALLVAALGLGSGLWILINAEPRAAAASPAPGVEAPRSLLARLSGAARPADLGRLVRGRATVVDGDTLVMNTGERIRLFGVDAFEARQNCIETQATVRCGQQAAMALDRLVAGRPIECEVQDRDRYQRLVAICWAGDVELNASLVRQGYALAFKRYSTRYAAAERLARETKAGVWAYGAAVTEPWRYRSEH